MIWLILVLWLILSIIVGIALGQFLQKCEDKSCNARSNSQAKNQTAPGADWGTWSTSTPLTHATWTGPGHDPSGNQY